MRAGVTLALAAAALLVTPVAVTASPRAPCASRKSKTVAANRAVRVYTVASSDEGGETIKLVACIRRTGQRRGLADERSDDSGYFRSFGAVRLRGRFAAYYTEESYVCRDLCDAILTSQRVVVANLRSGATMAVGTPSYPAAGRLLLDARGAIAWPVRGQDRTVAIHVRDAEGTRVLASGAIPPPSLRLTGAGLLSWSSAGDPRGARLRHRRSTATTLGAPLALTAPQDATFGDRGVQPRVAIDPSGTAIVLWTARSRVRMAARPAGGFFGSPFQALPGVGLTQQPNLALDRAGDAIAVWLRRRGSQYRVQVATRAPAGSFSPPVDVGAASGFSPAPQGAADPAGNTVVVWSDEQSSDDARVLGAIRPAGGSFLAPVALSAGGSARAPRVAIDAAGAAVVVWERTTISGTGSPHTTVEAVTRPAGRSFSAPVVLAGESSAAPELAMDGAGNALAAWVRGTGAATSLQAARRPAGGGFGSPVDVPGTQGARSVRLAMNAAGEALVAWQTGAGGFVSLLAPNGGFSAPHRVFSGPRIETALDGAAIGPSGEAAVTWTSYDGADTIVRAALRPAGRAFAAPVDVSPSGDDATLPSVAIDAAGSATFAWTTGDNRVFVAGRDSAGRGVAQTLLAGLLVRPSRFRVGRGGVQVSYALSRAARVRFTLERGIAGRRAGRGSRCRKPDRANRDNIRCTRYARVDGAFTRSGAAGARRFTFTGRLNGGRLAPGSYRLVAAPSAQARDGTISRTLFRILS